jgi:hypothetical protein
MPANGIERVSDLAWFIRDKVRGGAPHGSTEQDERLNAIERRVDRLEKRQAPLGGAPLKDKP